MALFTVAVEAQGERHAIKFGATHHNLEDQCQLAKGLSAGIVRPGVNRGTVQTVNGPIEPEAILVLREDGSEFTCYIDCREYEVVGYRHPAGLVTLAGGR